MFSIIFGGVAVVAPADAVVVVISSRTITAFKIVMLCHFSSCCLPLVVLGLFLLYFSPQRLWSHIAHASTNTVDASRVRLAGSWSKWAEEEWEWAGRRRLLSPAPPLCTPAGPARHLRPPCRRLAWDAGAKPRKPLSNRVPPALMNIHGRVCLSLVWGFAQDWSEGLA